MILTIDFGTSVTKVALWDEEGRGLVALARAELATSRPAVGWAEQDPLSWWTSVVIGCAEARAAAPDAFAAVDVVACSAARQTFVPVTAGGDPVGKGIMWSDRRAGNEAAALVDELGGPKIGPRLTGVPVDAGSVAAKLAWLEAHEPARLAAADWILSPRDLVLWRLTGEVMTDATLASRTGLFEPDGTAVDALVGSTVHLFPPVVPSTHVAGVLRAVPAAELGLSPGIPVVIGAGDRQCEVVGSGATAEVPMVSWGTTANVSVPVEHRPHPTPAGTVVSLGAVEGWLVEGGLSSAGSFLSWLSTLTGLPAPALADEAAASPPGARGVTAVPWLDGARAPWWRDDARAAFVGLGSAHDRGDVARAVIESVAWEVGRCLHAIRIGVKELPPPSGISLGGAGARIPVWIDVLTAVTGLPAVQRRSGEAASAGAAILAARAVGREVTLEDLDPIEDRIEPDAEAVEIYRELEIDVGRVARALLDVAPVPVPSLVSNSNSSSGTGSGDLG